LILPRGQKFFRKLQAKTKLGSEKNLFGVTLSSSQPAALESWGTLAVQHATLVAEARLAREGMQSKNGGHGFFLAFSGLAAVTALFFVLFLVLVTCLLGLVTWSLFLVLWSALGRSLVSGLLVLFLGFFFVLGASLHLVAVVVGHASPAEDLADLISDLGS
jgi:hypothetical protein